MERLLGYDVMDSSLEDCVEQILEHVAARRRGGTLACLNPHSYAVARGDTAFAAALRQATWLVPDGAGVVLASRLLGGAIRQRIAGPDVFLRLHERLDAIGGVRVFFLGASEDTLSRMLERIALEHPGIVFAGALSPPFTEQFSDAENAAMVAAVNGAAPDVLWIAMTAPKQEKWLHTHRELIAAPLCRRGRRGLRLLRRQGAAIVAMVPAPRARVAAALAARATALVATHLCLGAGLPVRCAARAVAPTNDSY